MTDDTEHTLRIKLNNAELRADQHKKDKDALIVVLGRVANTLDMITEFGMSHSEKNGAIKLVIKMINHEIRKDDIPF